MLELRVAYSMVETNEFHCFISNDKFRIIVLKRVLFSQLFRNIRQFS